MKQKVLCIYYSRTGNTRKAMEEISGELQGELVSITDNQERSGWRGYLRCGMDAMKKDSASLVHFDTEFPLSDYDLVILGTPVWAGRCSSVVRSFLKAHGRELQNVAYVVTRSTDGKFQEVYRQMDGYLPRPHRLAVSLRSGSVGYFFWQEDFLRQSREFLHRQ